MGATSTSQLKLVLTALLALHSALSDPGRLMLCLLAASASNALLGVQPDRRSLQMGRYYAAHPLLIRAGRSLEISCYLVQLTTRLGMLLLGLWLLLVGALTLYLYIPVWDAPYTLFRKHLGEPLLQFANGAVEVAWLMQLVWGIMPKGRFWSATRRVAPFVGILIALLALFEPMCWLQDRISDRRIRRARGADGNARNGATCLPAEAQLLIFHLLRTRAHFGAQEHQPGDTLLWFLNRPSDFSGAGDLAAAARVCAAWRGPATEVLYHDAVLRNAVSACQFSRAITSRPELARFVRCIVLPEREHYSPHQNNVKTWAEFSAAIEHIVSCCADAINIRLFREGTPLVNEIPGLRVASTHVSHLAIHCKLGEGYWKPDYEPEAVDLSMLLGLFPSLTSLTLSMQKVLFDGSSLTKAQRRALAGIQELCLGACTMDFQHLARLLRHLPNLRIAELRNPEFSGNPQRIAVSELFAAHLGTLVDLRVLLGSSDVPAAKRRILPSLVLSGFAALRSLTITVGMLSTLEFPPLGLQQLVVSFAPYSHEDRSACRRTLLDAVRAVRTLATSAPTLRAVQLWDDVLLAQLGHWAVASYMLREMLAPAGIALSVNLTIGLVEHFGLREKFSRQKALRRILWAGVF